MQTLTEALLDTLASYYQAAAQGYRARIEIDYVIPGIPEIGEMEDLNLAHGTLSNDDVRNVGTKTWQTPTLANDGNNSTKAFVYSGLDSFTCYLKSDLGAAFEVTSFSIYANNTPALITGFEYSTDGIAWTALTGVETGNRPVIVSDGDPGALFTFTAPITARYWAVKAQATGFHSSLYLPTWKINGTATSEVESTVETTSYQPKRIGIDKSRRMTAAQLDVELPNESGGIGVSPESAIRTNAPIRVYEWYGDTANETLTFTGLLDVIHESRDMRTVNLTARDMMKRLIEQTFSTIGPQGADEEDTVRTEANGVYLEKEADYIVAAILDLAGWPDDKRAITPTSYLLDEYILNDGASWADCIIGDDRLTGLTGYEAGATEDGTFYFRPMLAAVVADADTDAAAVYSYVISSADASNLVSRNVIRLDHEIDDYDLRTRVKVRGSLLTTTSVPAFTELWHTNKFPKPVGLWWEASDAGFLKVLDRSTKKIYRLRQSDREKVGTGIWPLDISADVTHPLGLSGDPADSDRFWVLDAKWRTTGTNLNASIHKFDASSGAHLAEYTLADGRWTDLKVSSSFIWVTNLDTDKIHKRDKADGSHIASYDVTYNSNAQINPTGVAIDGTTLLVFFLGHARFLLLDESAPTTVDSTNALGVTSGKISTAGTSIMGGEMDTTTHAHLFACSDDLGIVWKFALTTPVTDDRTVAGEVIDTELEDELGFLAGAEDREHDSHPGDADHPYEIRRETLTLRKTVTNIAQVTETAMRMLALLAHRREVLDLGIIGHPGLQLGDILQITDPVTEIDALYVLDTYRDNMDERGYLGTIACVPYVPTY